jgi:tetratricopeptide (TPR) repeat protein
MSARKTVRPWLDRHLVWGAAAWLFLALPAGLAEAAAANPEAVAKVVRLNKEARQFYDAMEYSLAEKSLKKALEIGEAAALGDHVVMAGTHGNLGVLYTTGIKNEDQALFHFKKALELRPDYVPNKEMSSPEVKELFQRAHSEMESTPAPPVPDTTETSTPSEGQLRCPAASVATAGSSLKLRCVAEGSLSASEVIVYFRPGHGVFRSRKMSTEKTLDGSPSWTTQLPPQATSGDQLFLYFEALNKKGDVLSSVGSEDNPAVVGIRSGDQGSEETGSGSRHARRVDEEGEGEGGAAKPAESGFWWIGLGLGSGIGYAGGAGPEIYKNTDFRAGYAWAKVVQVTPELGYFMTPNLSLSLQGRIQYISQPSSNAIAPACVAFLARLLYFSNGETVRFYAGPILGGGLGFRLVVSGLTTASGKTITDTVRGGPIVAGVGGGMSVGLSDSWSWILELNGLAGFPTFSMVLDFNTGLRVRF